MCAKGRDGFGVRVLVRRDGQRGRCLALGVVDIEVLDLKPAAAINLVKSDTAQRSMPSDAT
jgi:hypothetical protein